MLLLLLLMLMSDLSSHLAEDIFSYIGLLANCIFAHFAAAEKEEKRLFE